MIRPTLVLWDTIVVRVQRLQYLVLKVLLLMTLLLNNKVSVLCANLVNTATMKACIHNLVLMAAFALSTVNTQLSARRVLSNQT